TRSLLPKNTVVVAEIGETAFYKPWSYIKPQVLKFVAVDTDKGLFADDGKTVLQTNLYFFERRMSANTWPVFIDCKKRLQANVKSVENGVPVPDSWNKGQYTGQIAQAVCR
ncbi:hypothetical protein BWD09_13495, partial [Neisseria dentiae]